VAHRRPGSRIALTGVVMAHGWNVLMVASTHAGIVDDSATPLT
jgi:hypothetical protein